MMEEDDSNSNFEEGKEKDFKATRQRELRLGIHKKKGKFSFYSDRDRSTVIHCDCYFHSNDKPC